MNLAWDQAAPGITAAFRTMMSNPYARGQQQQVDAETAIAKALWQIEANKANADAARARANQDNEQTAILQRRPAIVDELAAIQANMGVPQFQEARSRRNQGLPAQVFDNGQQTMIDPKADTNIGRALLQNLPLLGVETWNPQQIAQASGEYADQNRVTDMISGQLDPAAVQAAQFAAKGSPRYGVQGNTVIDQLIGVQGPTKVGEAEISRDRAAAGASAAQAARTQAAAGGADKFVIKETENADGTRSFYRIPVKGNEGPIDTGGAQPPAKRDPNDVQGNAEYKAAYPYGAGANDPTQVEFLAMRKAGLDPGVEFKAILEEANNALKGGASLEAVRARLKQYGINPARIKAK